MQVSVIIPAYNAGAHIKEAIDSALAQTHPPLEVIVIDSGSTDETAKIAEGYAASGRVRLLSAPSRGAAAARNLGIKEARGEFIAFLDADDRWLPAKLEKQLALFSDENIGLAYCDLRFIGGKKGLYGATIKNGYRVGKVTVDLIRENFIATSGVIIRKSILDKSGLFLEDSALTIGEDYHLWLRASLFCEVQCALEVLAEYRVHDQQSSLDKKRNYECLNHLFELLLADSRFSEYRPMLKRRALEARLKKGYYGIFHS